MRVKPLQWRAMTDGGDVLSDSVQDSWFEVLERAIYVPSADTLVLADLHLGRAAASRVEAPIDDSGDVRDRLSTLVATTAPETVVVAGDLLHSFSSVPRGVDWHVTQLERSIHEAGAELIVTPGNHDSMLEAVYDGPTADTHLLGDGKTAVCHGHEMPSLEGRAAGIERVVVGHDHPAISIGGRKLPCVLYASDHWRGCDVAMVPAFTESAAGVTINRLRGAALQSPVIRDVGACRPIVHEEDGALWFPPLEACRSLL